MAAGPRDHEHLGRKTWDRVTPASAPIFFPVLISAASHLGIAPRPAKVLRPIFWIAVLGSHLSALQRAFSGTADCLLARRYPTPIAKGRKLTLQLASLAGENVANVVTQLQKSLNRHCRKI